MLNAEFATKHESLKLHTQYSTTKPTKYVGENTYSPTDLCAPAPNSYLLIQVCDWLTACYGVLDCTLAICCEKCEVPTYSSQKMSLKAANFPPRPTHLLTDHLLDDLCSTRCYYRTSNLRCRITYIIYNTN